MAEEKQQYQVQVKTKGKWTIRHQCEAEIEAFRHAELLLKKEKVSGVQVLLALPGKRGSGVHYRQIFEKLQHGHSPAPTTPSGTISSSDVCQTLSDLFRWPAREVLNLTLREYLDFYFVTPTEIMSNYGHLCVIAEADKLLSQSISIVAAAQVKKHGGKPTDRRKVLIRLFDDLKTFTGRVESDVDRVLIIPPRGLNDYDRILSDQLELTHLERQAYISASITKTLRRTRGEGWIGKMAALLSLLPDNESPTANVARAIDRFLSDILSGSTAIKEVLGGQIILGEAILTLTELLSGQLQVKSYMPACLARLQDLIAYGQVMTTQAQLTKRIITELESEKPLTKDNIDKEIEILDRIVTAQSVDMRLDERIQNAVTKRSSKQVPAEIQRIIGLVHDPLDRLELLLNIDTKIHGQGSAAAVLRRVDILLSEPEPIKRAILEMTNPMDQLRKLTSFYTKIYNLETFDSDKEASLNCVSDISFNILRASKIIHKLEAQAQTSSEAVKKLLTLGTNDILPEGKCMNALRSRVVSYTKAPNFLTEYTADAANKAQKEQILAEFRIMLNRVGLA